MPGVTCEWRERSELMQHGGTISYNLTAVCEGPVTHRVILPSWGGFDATTLYVCTKHAEEVRRGHGKVEPL